jgi:serine/threonine-protein kinase RsbW
VARTLTIPSRLEAIDDARAWAGGQAREAGVAEDDVFALELAMTEAISNVIRHAYGGDSGREVELELIVDAERLELVVTDGGEPFDAGDARRRDLEDPGEGGYGLHLIEELMDEVRREPFAGGTRTHLVRRRT